MTVSLRSSISLATALTQQERALVLRLARSVSTSIDDLDPAQAAVVLAMVGWRSCIIEVTRNTRRVSLTVTGRAVCSYLASPQDVPMLFHSTGVARL